MIAEAEPLRVGVLRWPHKHGCRAPFEGEAGGGVGLPGDLVVGLGDDPGLHRAPVVGEVLYGDLCVEAVDFGEIRRRVRAPDQATREVAELLLDQPVLSDGGDPAGLNGRS